MEVLLTPGVTSPIQCYSQIVTTNKPTPNFLQAGCPSCRATKSVKALKGNFQGRLCQESHCFETVNFREYFVSRVPTQYTFLARLTQNSIMPNLKKPIAIKTAHITNSTNTMPHAKNFQCAQEAQLMLTNPRDRFRGQSRSPKVPFHMLGTVSSCATVTLSLRHSTSKNVTTLKSGSEATRGH